MTKEIKNSAKKYWSEIYKDKRNIFNNNICNSCRKYFQHQKKVKSSPQPLPYVGSKYNKDRKYRLFIVGKGTFSNEITRGYDIFTDE